MPDAGWLGPIVCVPLIFGLAELAVAVFEVRGRRGFGLLMLAGLALCASALTAALLVSYAQYIHSCD
jgi:hypothetical protein